jgi:predicted RNA-binding Zn-ribbon protein involved in translation (DUF1610 family)
MKSKQRSALFAGCTSCGDLVLGYRRGDECPGCGEVIVDG